jgi:hypothetical protein
MRILKDNFEPSFISDKARKISCYQAAGGTDTAPVPSFLAIAAVRCFRPRPSQSKSTLLTRLLN